MQDLIDLETYPLDRLDSAEGATLIAHCRARLEADGMVDLPGFLRAPALRRAVAEVAPVLEHRAFFHSRQHNIYFKPSIPGLAPDHPALAEAETAHRSICADQIPGSVLVAVYELPEIAVFLAAAMGKPALYPMADPLARVNAMRYGAGQALGWHFDRSEFTTTLLLQKPQAGGVFEYARDLRSAEDPNHQGVARLLAGEIAAERSAPEAGTLTIFRGRNTAHRVTPVEGAVDRIIAVFSYFERPGVMFSAEERIGFYGRAG